ncbi:MAG TPA: hypothetical protein VKB58_01240 [Terriglobales bacterium]|nr:hypothetical protein [Terriglobales bacterium]
MPRIRSWELPLLFRLGREHSELADGLKAQRIQPCAPVGETVMYSSCLELIGQGTQFVTTALDLCLPRCLLEFNDQPLQRRPVAPLGLRALCPNEVIYESRMSAGLRQNAAQRLHIGDIESGTQPVQLGLDKLYIAIELR